jgi:hypothetical protein
MSATECACGFNADPNPQVRRWSKLWHTHHMAAHLDAFPDLDQRSRDNLALLIEWADA